MILTVAVFLSAFGFATWILGTLFQMQGIGVIGAVIVVGVGAMTTAGGLEYKDGERHTAGNDNVTEIQNTYQSVDTPTRLPLGTLVMLLGGTMVLRSLDKAGG